MKHDDDGDESRRSKQPSNDLFVGPGVVEHIDLGDAERLYEHLQHWKDSETRGPESRESITKEVLEAFEPQFLIESALSREWASGGEPRWWKRARELRKEFDEVAVVATPEGYAGKVVERAELWMMQNGLPKDGRADGAMMEAIERRARRLDFRLLRELRHQLDRMRAIAKPHAGAPGGPETRSRPKLSTPPSNLPPVNHLDAHAQLRDPITRFVTAAARMAQKPDFCIRRDSLPSQEDQDIDFPVEHRWKADDRWYLGPPLHAKYQPPEPEGGPPKPSPRPRKR